MNMSRTMAQSFLVAAMLIVSNAMAADWIIERIQVVIDDFVYKKPLLSLCWHKTHLIPAVGAFMVSNCREGSASDKAISTLTKTVLFTSSKQRIGNLVLLNDTIPRFSAFAVADTGVRFVAEYVGSIGGVKSGVAKIKGIVGTKVANLVKEVVVGYAAYRITAFGINIVSGSDAEIDD